MFATSSSPFGNVISSSLAEMLCAGSKPVSNRWPSSSKYERRQYRASMSRGSMISIRTRDARLSLSTSAIAVTRRSRGGSVSGVKIDACHQSGEGRSSWFGWITKSYMVFHHQRAGCADGGGPRDVEFCPRCEDAHPTRARRIVLRQDEGRFAEIEFASNLLQALS